MLSVLFTEGTSLSARQTLYALDPKYRSPEAVRLWGQRTFEVDVMDPSKLCQCRFSSKVNHFYQSSHYAKEPTAFLNELDQRLRSRHYDVLLPTHEQTILLSRFREKLGSRVGIALPEFDSVMTMQDKAAFMRLLTELNIPIPTTAYAVTREQLDRQITFPCFLKQSHSTAGGGVFRLENELKYEQAIARLEQKALFGQGSEWLIQRPARGVMATVKAVFQHGRLVSLGMYEARQQGLGGMSPARRSANHPSVVVDIERIGEHLNWHGGMFLDYFFDEASGQVEYLEGNPRIGETFNPTLAGENLVEAWVRVSMGHLLPTVEIRPEKNRHEIGIRSQSFFMILIGMAYDGASRSSLAKESLRFLMGKGVYQNSQDELSRPLEDWLSGVVLIWIIVQLLAWPRRARTIVASTIETYSLPESALTKIREAKMPIS